MRIGALRDEDRRAWEGLAIAYNQFYDKQRPPADYERTWQRLMAGEGIYGISAYQDGTLVGIAHYLVHGNVWGPGDCYLQDLFVAPEMRGRGIARELITQVALCAKQHGASCLYWLTHRDNQVARALYDKLAEHTGFICYDYVFR